MADPYVSGVDQTSHKPPDVSPTLANQFRPLLEQIQTLLQIFSHPDAAHEPTIQSHHAIAASKNAGNSMAQPPFPFSETHLTPTHAADVAPLSLAHLDISTNTKKDGAPSSAPLGVSLSPPANKDASGIHARPDQAATPYTMNWGPDLDPHFFIQSPSPRAASGVSGFAPPVTDVKNSGKTPDVDSHKKSFLNALCGAPDVLSEVVVDEPKMVGGTPLVEIDEEEYLGSLSKCSIQLLAKISLMQGKKPYDTKALKSKLDSLWILQHPWKLIPLGKGYFCLRFNSKDDQDLIWSRDLISLKPGVLRVMKWQRDFNPNAQKQITAQIWVRFLHLPIEYWSPKILYGLAKAVGIPLRIDQATLNLEFGYFARVLVDIDMLNPLSDHIMVQRKGHSFYVDLEFERVPPQCTHCGYLGHILKDCRHLKAAQNKAPQSKPQANQWQVKRAHHQPHKTPTQPDLHPSTYQPSKPPDICPATQTPPAQSFDILQAHALYNSSNPLANPPVYPQTAPRQPSLPPAQHPAAALSRPTSAAAAPPNSAAPLTLSMTNSLAVLPTHPSPPPALHSQPSAAQNHPPAHTPQVTTPATPPDNRENATHAPNSPVVQYIGNVSHKSGPPSSQNSFAALEGLNTNFLLESSPKNLQNTALQGKLVEGFEEEAPAVTKACKEHPVSPRAYLSASAAAFTPMAPPSYKDALQCSSVTPIANSFAALATNEGINEGCFLVRQDSPPSSLIRELDTRSRAGHSSSLVQEVEARFTANQSCSDFSSDSFPITLSKAQKKALKRHKAKMRDEEIQRVIAFASGTPMPDESVDTMDLSLAEFSKKILKPSKLKIKKSFVKIR